MESQWFGTPLTPLAGGYSAETFLVGDDGDEQVLRIYRRNPDRCLVDAALLRLLTGILPVPRVVDCRPAAGDKPGVLVTERLPGMRLDRVLADAGVDVRVAVGHELGRILARLSAIPQVRFGMFANADLAISAEGLPDDLMDWAARFRDTGRLAAWKDQDYRGLERLLAQAEEQLAGETGSGDRLLGPALTRVVLAHSDFNPKNLLADPATGQVTAVLDWEFAHAGSPYTDLGNLTRFERHPDFLTAVVKTFVQHAPVLGPNPLTLSRCVDLWALVELAGRPSRGAVQDLATTLLLAQARAGDVHAWPWDAPRVDPADGNAVF